MKFMLYGDGDSEPKQADVKKLGGMYRQLLSLAVLNGHLTDMCGVTDMIR